MLIHHKYKRVGWIILIPSVILGFWTLIAEVEPAIFNFNIPWLQQTAESGWGSLFSGKENNLWNEILGLLVIVSSWMVGFSKEPLEDEYLMRLRLNALLWAVFVNYIVLAISMIFVYGIDFYWVLILNMYTVLFIYIGRFNYLLYQSKKGMES